MNNQQLRLKIIGETLIEITSNTLAKNIYLIADDVFFHENYFDLLPNEKRIIKLSKPAKDIKVMSLFDTMK